MEFNTANNTPSGHVRSTDGAIIAAIREGYRTSPTFHDIVDALEASDVIVYVEPGTCRVNATGCLLFGAHGGDARYLRAIVRRSRGDPDLIARIGHELHHAHEVAGSAGVVDAQKFAEFYIARSLRPLAMERALTVGLETAAALAVQAQIAWELTSTTNRLEPPARRGQRRNE
jgi:hypothetical protein